MEYYSSGYEYYYGVTTQYLTYDGGDFSYTVSGLNTGYDYIKFNMAIIIQYR